MGLGEREINHPLLGEQSNNVDKRVNDDGVVVKNIPLSQHKHKKHLFLIYIFYSLSVMASYLYGLFIPNVFLDYVSYKYPDLSPQDQQSKASYYKSYADSIPYISMFLIGPLLGVLSDKIGRKPIIFIGIFFATLDVISCYISSITNSLIPFFVFHSIAGLANSMVSAIFSYIADISVDEHVPILFSIASISQGAGIILGPLMNWVLSYFSNKHLPLFVSVFVYGACAFVVSILKEGLEIAKQENKIIHVRNNFNPFKLIKILFSTSNSGYLTCLILLYCSIAYSSQDLMGTYYYYTILEYNWDKNMHSYFIGAIGVIMIIWGSCIIPFLLKYFSTRKLISTGFFISIVAHCLFISSGYSQYLFWAGGALIGYVPNNANLIQGLISIASPSELQGTIITSVQSLGAIVGFASELAVNDIYSYATSTSSRIYFPQLTYLVNGSIVFITFFFSLIIWRVYKNQILKNTTTNSNIDVNTVN